MYINKSKKEKIESFVKTKNTKYTLSHPKKVSNFKMILYNIKT